MFVFFSIDTYDSYASNALLFKNLFSIEFLLCWIFLLLFLSQFEIISALYSCFTFSWDMILEKFSGIIEILSGKPRGSYRHFCCFFNALRCFK